MCPVLLNVSGFVEDGCRNNPGRNESEGIKKESPLARELPIKKSDIELRRGSSLKGDFSYINEPVISWSHVPAE